MKKLLIIITLFPALFYGCKKGSSDDVGTSQPEQELFDVKLTARGFEQTVEPITSKSIMKGSNKSSSKMVPPSDKPSGVRFLVYANNELIGSYHSSIYDEKGNESKDGGNLSIQLPKGKYSVYAIAYDGYSGYFNWQDMHPSQFWFEFQSEQIGQYSIRRFTPLFICRTFEFEVKGEEFNGTIELNRYSALLEIDIKDEVREEVDYILFGGNLSPDVLLEPSQAVNTGGVGMSSGYVLMDVSALHGQQKKVLSSVFYPKQYSTDNTSKPDNYEILFFDKNDKLLGSRTVDNVIFKENHITRLSGNLFDQLEDPTRDGLFSINLVENYNSSVIDNKL